MHLPTLPWSSHTHVYVEGDVSIDANAAIAPGVILRADPDSKIIIAAGVCIGMGSVLHAHGGILEVEAGANLGSGVLVVGKGTVGANACIGAVTTILNSSIEPWQVVPAASMVGDKGREVASTASPTSVETPKPADSSPASQTAQDSLNGQVPSHQEIESATTESSKPSSPSKATSEPDAPSTSDVGKTVYGQASLDRILKTLLPYNQSLNRPPEDG
jgi:carbon dioxide concentrating mechanism protein CcmN